MSERRRVIIVSYHHLPSLTPGSLRVAALSRELMARGWDVTVVTATPGSVIGHEGVDVVTVPVMGQEPGAAASGAAGRAVARVSRILSFPDRFAGWMLPLQRAVGRLLREHPNAVVLSTSPPHSTQFALAVLRKRRRFRWVAEFRDPWTAPRRHPGRRHSVPLMRRMEAMVLKSCDAAIANTPGNRVALQRAFPGIAPYKLHVITNGYDEALLSRDGSVDARGTDLTYVGEIYPGMVDVYIAALERIRSRNPENVPTLTVVGNVDPGEKAKLEAAGLADVVRYRGFLPYEESLDAMLQAKALLVLLPRDEVWASCVPSKVYPYLAVRRPVLAVVPEGDTAEIVRGCGAGVAVTSRDADAAALAIEDFVCALRSGREMTERNPGAVREYSLRAIGERVHGLLESVAGDHGTE